MALGWGFQRRRGSNNPRFLDERDGDRDKHHGEARTQQRNTEERGGALIQQTHETPHRHCDLSALCVPRDTQPRSAVTDRALVLAVSLRTLADTVGVGSSLQPSPNATAP